MTSKNSNDISIKAIDGILDHNKRSLFTSFLDQPDKKLLKEKKENIIKRKEEKEKEYNEEIRKIQEKIDRNANVDGYKLVNDELIILSDDECLSFFFILSSSSSLLESHFPLLILGFIVSNINIKS